MTKTQLILGFDYGKKRIGVAIGQLITRTATPLMTLPAVNGVPDWTLITKLIEQWQPSALVVGIPYNMDGSEAPITHDARRFIRQLSSQVALTIHEVDERLSTVAVQERVNKNKKKNTAKKTHLSLDAFAAQVILETWLLTNTN